jgi:hypothetical protein
MAVEILGFVLENTKIWVTCSGKYLPDQNKIEKAKEKDFATINAEIEALLTEYEISPLPLQLIQAHLGCLI